MKILTKLFLLKLILTSTLYSAEQQVLIWDYDGTIVAEHIDPITGNKPILPNVASLMQRENTINIICSGIRALRPTTHHKTLPPQTITYPTADIEKFIQLMHKLPIKAVVFSYALGGAECWVLIKTDTDIEVRTAHEDDRYLHLVGLFKKPDTGMLHVIKDLLSEWNIKTDDLLFIGDTQQDQQAAETYGIPFQHAFTIHAGELIVATNTQSTT